MPGTSGAGGQAGGHLQGRQALPTPEGSNGDLTAQMPWGVGFFLIEGQVIPKQ